MLLDKTTIRPWARRNGWQPGERGMLHAMVGETYRCDDCSERYTSRDDMAADEDGCLLGYCEWCAGNDVPNESTLYARNGHVVG